MSNHEVFMRRAIALARRGNTSPNPMVGAVIVKDGEVVGEGYHTKAGEAHAEVVAIRNAGSQAKDATIYVTLEPCCHFGRTPPCTKAVIGAGIKKVVAAMVDPNPKVGGNGIAELQSAGIETVVGVLEAQSRKLNESFIKYITTQTPFVTLKMATTLDGKIATRTGDSKWISCDKSRREVHRLRSRTDAILVGVGTVTADDPELSARSGRSVSYPTRIVADSMANTPLGAKMLALPDGETIIAVTSMAPADRIRKLSEAGARIIIVDELDGQVNMKSLMKALGEMKITSVMIEGGGRLAAGALSSGVVDKVMVFVAPKIIGGESARTAVEGLGISSMADALHLNDLTVRNMGCDVLIEAYPCSVP